MTDSHSISPTTPESSIVSSEDRPEMPRYSAFTRLIAAVIALVGGIMVVGMLWALKPLPQTISAEVRELAVEVIDANPTRFSPSVVLYGETVAGRTLDLRSAVRGKVFKLSQKMRDGEFVTQGETLVVIDDFDYDVALTKAVSTRDNTKAAVAILAKQLQRQTLALKAGEEQLALHEDDYKRAVSLAASDAVTDQYVETKKLKVINSRDQVDGVRSGISVLKDQINQQKAMLQSHEATVSRAKRDLTETVITAPFDGLVKSVTAVPGGLLRNDESVAKIIESGEIEIRFTVPASVVGRLLESGKTLVGQPITASWVGGRELSNIKGNIDRVASQGNAAGGGLTVYARLNNAPGDNPVRQNLIPGLFVRVEMSDRTYDGLIALPIHAIHDEEFVYVVQNDSSLRRVLVNVVALTGDTALISSDMIKRGEKIVSSSIIQPRQNTRVTIVQ